MAEFNDTYRKAGLLMTSALKKYEEGDFESGDRDRAEANRMYDLAEQQVDSAQNTTILYGENRNFGIAYRIFESNTPSLFNDKKRKKNITKVLKLIKEDKTLKSQFELYKALVYPESVSNAEEYVNEALSLIPKFDKKQIIESNEKFINLMRDMNLNEMVELSDDDANLFEAIEYVMLNKKTLSNLNEYVDAKECIKEHIGKNCKYSQVVENKTMDEVYDDAVNEMQKKYDKELTNEEKHLIESVSSLADKQTYFNLSKNDAINALNNQINECSNDEEKKSLNKIIENIKSKGYNENTVVSDIAEFKEIKDTIIKEDVNRNDQIEKLATALAYQYKGYDGSATAVSTRDKTKSELAYILPGDIQQEEVFDDIEKLSQRYDPKDVGYMIVSNIMSGEYKGWWTKDTSPRVF